ncbi:MAG TPA: hypothetical protein ACFYD7_11970 [Candidatus Wujingus californicus]|uniref:hypothetical protein n=1 Tax=Candidatus Wujingus californicus TaxID=3367618 RepID=UPI001D638010|nr:hypothetical protein [Planctomycetota bacterium]MDO8131947.1 hypothetical protein [Candidatus Brocadiales bacterium]
MIKTPDLLKKLEDEFIRNEGRLNYRQSLKLFTDMWNEGVRLGILPPKDPLEGLEVDIKIAKVLNSCLKNSSQK